MDRGSTGAGVVLIVLGLLFLIGQALDVGRYGWPFFIIVPGLVMLAAGLAEARRASGGLAIPGMIVTTTGLLLLYQSTTDHWESWAYAWALIAPTSVGVALVLLGVASGDRGRIRGGIWLTTIGLTLFLVGGAFFEGVLHISGRDLGVVGNIGFPLALIVLGVLVLVGRLAPRS